jgi:uncharacterized protein (DUF3820 family)
MKYELRGATSAPSVKQLQDTDPMPFGKHKGSPMQDVPASYLHWLWSNGKEHDKQCRVADYIRRNLNALSVEYSDGIWE